MRAGPDMAARRGQVALYLLAALVVLCILAAMNVSVFVAVRARNRVENAGDAAALAAARVQGRLLNEIGRLNVAHVLAALAGDRAECERIVMEQRRLALLGPVDALRAADAAARENGMEVRPEFSAILREHVRVVREVYAHGANAAGEPYPEPWPGAWQEYADAIAGAISGGLATGPDNCEFYGTTGGHLLLDMNFYHAIAGRSWCWFKFHALDTLRHYDDYGYWGPLPVVNDNPLENSELFSLHVRAWRGSFLDLFSAEEIAAAVERFAENAPAVAAEAVKRARLLGDRTQTWFLYDPGAWRKWWEISPSGESRFPVVGEVRPEYDVRGCAAICRCIHTGDRYVWSAAAKPFGTLPGAEGPATASSLHGFVLPCFTAVRLVPLDAVGGQNLATADWEWVSHVRQHLWTYLDKGPEKIPAVCFYCRQLMEWERAAFRRIGIDWLELNGGKCRVTGGPGGGHGGTSHGH